MTKSHNVRFILFLGLFHIICDELNIFRRSFRPCLRRQSNPKSPRNDPRSTLVGPTCNWLNHTSYRTSRPTKLNSSLKSKRSSLVWRPPTLPSQQRVKCSSRASLRPLISEKHRFRHHLHRLRRLLTPGRVRRRGTRMRQLRRRVRSSSSPWAGTTMHQVCRLRPLRTSRELVKRSLVGPG